MAWAGGYAALIEPGGCAAAMRSESGGSNTKKAPLLGCFFRVGAATRIRTGDLMLTKHVLYQLSHSSLSSTVIL